MKNAGFFKKNAYVAGSYDTSGDFQKLNKELEKYEKGGKANRLFYLALPPSVYQTVTRHIKEQCMAKE